MPHILFIASTRIGDAVLSSGAIDYARGLLPGADVTLALGALPAPLFRAAPGVARIHVIEKRSKDAHWFDLIKAMRKERFDLAVDLRGTLVTYWLRAKRRIIFRKSALVRHKVEEITALMRAPKPLAPKLYPDAKARADAQAAFNLPGRMLVLGAGANYVGKRWRPDRFAAVARRLTGPSGALAGAHVVLLGGVEDKEIAHEIVRSLDADAIAAHDLCGKLDLLACAALLDRATLFIGNDSGLMHIAAACNAPTLGLFGPSDDRIYGPWGARAKALRGETLSALQAQRLIHPDKTLMDDLTVDAVEQAATDLMRAGGLA